MDRGRIENSAVKLAEAAASSDDPWFTQRLGELARELAALTCQALEAARPTQRTSCAHWTAAPAKTTAERALRRLFRRLATAFGLRNPLPVR